MIIHKKYWTLFIFGFGITTFSILVLFAITFLLSHCYEWCISDWLINYQGGIVRRGFTGELLFNLARLTGINQIIYIISFQIFLYGIFLYNACRLAMYSSFSVFNIVLFLSPAFILFPILDPLGSFRKEILLFALLSCLCTSQLFKTKLSKYINLLLSIGSIFIALSHEMLIVFLPYLIIAALLHEKSLGRKTKGVIFAIAPSIVIGLLLTIFASGNEQTVIDICNSLAKNAPSDCAYPNSHLGAISFLSKDFSFAHEFVRNSISGNTLIIYILLTILSFTPIFSIMVFEKSNIFPNKEVQFWLKIFIIIPISFSILLLWFVADYGRIIYINIVCITLIILMATPDKNNSSLSINSKTIISIFLCLTINTSWRLIHWKATFENAFPLLVYLINLLH